MTYRPPAWQRLGRAGSIDVPGDAALVVVEGVGAGRRDVMHLVDATVFVQVDLDVGRERTAARVSSGEADAVGVVGWMAEEEPFVDLQQPWERARLVVAGSPVSGVRAPDPVTEIVVGTTAVRRRAP